MNWGDGGGSIPFSQLENAEIVPSDTPGVYAVFGTHTYNLDRNYLINVLVRDSASGTGGLLGVVFGFLCGPTVTADAINRITLAALSDRFAWIVPKAAQIA